MKQLVALALTLLVLAGCGGQQPDVHPTPATPELNVSGVWTGWLTPSPPVPGITPLRAKISQGKAGNGAAPLTIAIEFDSPLCFALMSGKGEGTLVGDRVIFTLHLNDGGEMTLQGRVVGGHLKDGLFLTEGGCQGAGTVALDRIPEEEDND